MYEPNRAHSALWSFKLHKHTKNFFFFREFYDTAIGGEWVFAGNSSYSKNDVHSPGQFHFEMCGMHPKSDFCDPQVVKRYHHCLRDNPKIYMHGWRPSSSPKQSEGEHVEATPQL